MRPGGGPGCGRAGLPGRSQWHAAREGAASGGLASRAAGRKRRRAGASARSAAGSEQRRGQASLHPGLPLRPGPFLPPGSCPACRHTAWTLCALAMPQAGGTELQGPSWARGLRKVPQALSQPPGVWRAVSVSALHGQHEKTITTIEAICLVKSDRERCVRDDFTHMWRLETK